ncbi:hypothetical protein D3C73_1640700 [compost metagenome]
MLIPSLQPYVLFPVSVIDSLSCFVASSCTPILDKNIEIINILTTHNDLREAFSQNII